jgi:hypothetical protein
MVTRTRRSVSYTYTACPVFNNFIYINSIRVVDRFHFEFPSTFCDRVISLLAIWVSAWPSVIWSPPNAQDASCPSEPPANTPPPPHSPVPSSQNKRRSINVNIRHDCPLPSRGSNQLALASAEELLRAQIFRRKTQCDLRDVFLFIWNWTLSEVNLTLMNPCIVI